MGVCESVLQVEDVLDIHNYVVEYFANTDPISPGVLNENLLRSAMDRPFAGCPHEPKYSDYYLVAATYSFGIAKNHSFQDGNKRTAMVVMLSYLDAVKIQIRANVSSKALSDLMIALVDDRIHLFGDIPKLLSDYDYYRRHVRRLLLPPNLRKYLKKVEKLPKDKYNADLSVYLLALWLKKYTRKKEYRERPVTLRELRQILSKFNMQIEQTGGNKYKVLRETEVKKSLFSRRSEKIIEPCYTLHVGGDGRLIHIDQIKGLKNQCGLSDYDYHVFYGDKDPPDYIIQEHSAALRRLAAYDKTAKK